MNEDQPADISASSPIEQAVAELRLQRQELERDSSGAYKRELFGTDMSQHWEQRLQQIGPEQELTIQSSDERWGFLVVTATELARANSENNLQGGDQILHQTVQCIEQQLTSWKTALGCSDMQTRIYHQMSVLILLSTMKVTDIGVMASLAIIVVNHIFVQVMLSKMHNNKVFFQF
jgi:hypothetical protein